MIRMQDILQERISNGDTVKQLSESTGISNVVLYYLLKGTNKRYSTYVAEQLSKCFEVEIKEVEEFQNLYKKDNCNKIDARPLKDNSKSNIVKKNCINTDCLLNKECKCMSDHVNLGLAGCVSYNKEPNNFPKDLISNNRKRLVLNQESCLKYNERGVGNE